MNNLFLFPNRISGAAFRPVVQRLTLACVISLVEPCYGQIGIHVPEWETLRTADTTRAVQLEYNAPRAQVASPANAWDPLVEPFPTDLGAAVTRAREYLLATREITGPLTRALVTIEPTTIVQEPREGRRHPVRRWMIVTTFTSTSADGTRVGGDELAVVMLLDGTIAEPTLIRGTLTYPFRNKPRAQGEPRGR